MTTDFDLIIVGGGIVGSSLACALSVAGLGDMRVLLIHAQTRPRMPEAEADITMRVSAINLGSKNFFSSIGIWQDIPPMKLCPFSGMRVKDSEGNGQINFDGSEMGQEFLGFIVENQSLNGALWQRLESSTISSVEGKRVVGLDWDRRGVRLEMDDGQAVTTRLVVGADGAESAIRRAAKIPVAQIDFHHSAVVANVSTELAHGNLARQIFLPEGPLAFLPLADGRCSIVWSTAPGQAEWIMGLTEREFCRELTLVSDSWLGEIGRTDERGCFPLKGIQAQSYIAERVALIGDAAHLVHPLAGLGLNMGIADAASLVEVLKQAVARGRAIDDFLVLRRYERWRRGENRVVIDSIRGLKWLFEQEGGAWSGLRNTGLTLTNRLGPGKRWLIRQAAGIGAGQPESMRQP